MIEFKITYNYKDVKKTIVGITNGAMTAPADTEGNQLTEVDVYQNQQKPNKRWNIGPSYIHSLYFDNQGATLHFKLTTDADGNIKRRDFIGMNVYEDNEDLGIVDVVSVPFTVQTRYIE